MIGAWMGDCAGHGPPSLKITEVINLELHDGTAEAPQRFYTLEQLGGLAYTIRMVSQAMQSWREQIDQQMKEGKREQAFGIYQQLEQQRDYLVEQIRRTRPFLMELDDPLASAAQKLAEQLAAFPLMSKGYAGLTDVLTRFADALPDHQTASASVIGRLMNNVRMGHYPTDLGHVGHIARSISFPAGVTANLLDPCCGTGDALLRLSLGADCRCYGIELDDHRAQRAQEQLYRVGFGSFFGAHISPGTFHTVFLNPPYLSVLSEAGGRSRDEKRFLVESIPLLMFGGLLIYIVPYYRLTEDLCQIICDNFEQVRIHRFMDGEFKKFRQVVVMGARQRRADSGEDAEALYAQAQHPENLPAVDLLPDACYALPAVPRKIETFRGAVFNEDELARQLARSGGFDRLFAKSRLDSEPKRPPLPLSIGQVGLIGGSGLINGLMECEYPHIIKGRIVKERHTVTEENRGPNNRLMSTEIRETISNRMIFNILTPSGFRSLT